VGHVSGESGRPHIALRQELFPGDVLRVGYEDEPWHMSLRISRPFSEGTLFHLTSGSKATPQNGAPVFLTDRREPQLIAKILELEAHILPVKPDLPPSRFQAILPRSRLPKTKAVDQRVYRKTTIIGKGREEIGIWLSKETFQAVSLTPDICQRIWWWLTPALWPVDEADFKYLIEQLLHKGFRQFVLNAPWQIAFFKNPWNLSLWAGPFCNLANPLALETAAGLGFSGAIVSPELAAADFLKLPGRSPLPLGVVVGGNWPLCVARVISADLQLQSPLRSPKGEDAWAVRHGSLYWVFPNWELDLREQTETLRRAGYRLFVHLVEPVPPAVKRKDRPGLWNWAGELR